MRINEKNRKSNTLLNLVGNSHYKCKNMNGKLDEFESKYEVSKKVMVLSDHETVAN
ncbi:hypothetical protein FC96_GL001178 [Secundilactobacillus kimchicus JCM 15530]|uniref:Uncharacterized protein n=1 Tax=Secundilactobacillus kimchicus JCM 15530 TaxID=1302272 RepID=A0A0R1HTI8_9LACO|nr:hypothetical protein FC96_GL001178 [Secundilactobacillus kimchicus JCM 15530]